jgi:hypothetical protein
VSWQAHGTSDASAYLARDQPPRRQACQQPRLRNGSEDSRRCVYARLGATANGCVCPIILTRKAEALDDLRPARRSRRAPVRGVPDPLGAERERFEPRQESANPAATDTANKAATSHCVAVDGAEPAPGKGKPCPGTNRAQTGSFRQASSTCRHTRKTVGLLLPDTDESLLQTAFGPLTRALPKTLVVNCLRGRLRLYDTPSRAGRHLLRMLMPAEARCNPGIFVHDHVVAT